MQSHTSSFDPFVEEESYTLQAILLLFVFACDESRGGGLGTRLAQ